MKIVTLIENLVTKAGLVAEHGLSIYIETETRKILFDTGQSGLFMQNAKILNVDIQEIDTLILSHGHYDHTGGLYPFLAQNSKAKIYAKRDIFNEKQNTTRFIGTIYKDEVLKDRLFYVDDLFEIAPDIFIVPDIIINDPTDTHFNGLFVKNDTEMVTDEFTDELFLAIIKDEQLQIITACSHRGITNICFTAKEQFNLPIKSIIGGFHMKECSVEQYVQSTHFIRQLALESIGVCHCTGIEKYADLVGDCDARVFYNYTGNAVEI